MMHTSITSKNQIILPLLLPQWVQPFTWTCLYVFQQMQRKKHHLNKMTPYEDPLKAELLSGKFTILVSYLLTF